MSVGKRRGRAIFRKKLRENRRNVHIVLTMAIFPLILVIIPLFEVLALPASASRPAVASAVPQGPDLLAQVLFTPLLAGWSIWVGIAISTRSSDFRAAQQLGTLASLPPLVVTYLITYNVIHATLGLAPGLAAALLLVDGLGWRIVSAMFDPYRSATARVTVSLTAANSAIHFQGMGAR